MMTTLLKMLVFTLCVLVMEELFYRQLRWYITPFDAIPIDTYLIGWGLYTTVMVGVAWNLIFGARWRVKIKTQNAY